VAKIIKLILFVHQIRPYFFLCFQNLVLYNNNVKSLEAFIIRMYHICIRKQDGRANNIAMGPPTPGF